MKECICDIKEGIELKIEEGNWVDLYIYRKESGYWIVGEGDGRSYLKINYCPICGKRLVK